MVLADTSIWVENEAELWSRDAHFAKIGTLVTGLIRFQPGQVERAGA